MKPMKSELILNGGIVMNLCSYIYQLHIYRWINNPKKNDKAFQGAFYSLIFQGKVLVTAANTRHCCIKMPAFN